MMKSCFCKGVRPNQILGRFVWLDEPIYNFSRDLAVHVMNLCHRIIVGFPLGLSDATAEAAA